MNTPTVTLTSYNMGSETTEDDFDAWVGFVADRIDAATGFTVDVESFRFGESQFEDAVSHATDEQTENIREALRSIWDAWCSGSAS